MSGIINQGAGHNAWGICGFVGVLNALHQDGKLTEFGSSLSQNQIEQRLGGEIITFLKMTAVERPDIAAAIVAFTQSFGMPYSSYVDIADICRRIAVEMQRPTVGTLGIALPPLAVAQYAKFAGLNASWKIFQSAGFTRDNLLDCRGCIIGCGREPKTDPYNGLRHWVYVNPKGCLLNWGVSTDLTKQDIPQAVKNANFTYIQSALLLT
jgi:hypothetical protein